MLYIPIERNDEWKTTQKCTYAQAQANRDTHTHAF